MGLGLSRDFIAEHGAVRHADFVVHGAVEKVPDDPLAVYDARRPRTDDPIVNLVAALHSPGSPTAYTDS